MKMVRCWRRLRNTITVLRSTVLYAQRRIRLKLLRWIRPIPLWGGLWIKSREIRHTWLLIRPLWGSIWWSLSMKMERLLQIRITRMERMPLQSRCLKPLLRKASSSRAGLLKLRLSRRMRRIRRHSSKIASLQLYGVTMTVRCWKRKFIAKGKLRNIRELLIRRRKLLWILHSRSVHGLRLLLLWPRMQNTRQRINRLFVSIRSNLRMRTERCWILPYMHTGHRQKRLNFLKFLRRLRRQTTFIPLRVGLLQ